jgi:hypothetical protein
MFEPRRYFENENNLNRARRIGQNLEILCSPKFEEIFDKLFDGIGREMAKPRVYSIRVPERNKEDVAHNKKLKDDFHWKIDDVCLDEGDACEDEEPANVPPSIFDMLASGKEFKDIVSPKPKHTEIYNQAFGLDDDGNEIDLPEDDDEEEEDEEVPEVKNPFVFIANRLTFLIKTSQPIIWDTSTIATPSKDCIFVAFDKRKNPNLDMRLAAKIAHKVNIDMDIQQEIDEYFEGTEWETIYCMPHIMNLKGEDRLGFVFAVTSKND